MDKDNDGKKAYRITIDASDAPMYVVFATDAREAKHVFCTSNEGMLWDSRPSDCRAKRYGQCDVWLGFHPDAVMMDWNVLEDRLFLRCLDVESNCWDYECCGNCGNYKTCKGCGKGICMKWQSDKEK